MKENSFRFACRLKSPHRINPLFILSLLLPLITVGAAIHRKLTLGLIDHVQRNLELAVAGSLFLLVISLLVYAVKSMPTCPACEKKMKPIGRAMEELGHCHLVECPQCHERYQLTSAPSVHQSSALH